MTNLGVGRARPFFDVEVSVIADWMMGWTTSWAVDADFWGDALWLVGVVLLSGVKFFAAPFLAYRLHYSYLEIVACTVAGGMLGVWVFSKFSVALMRFYHHFRAKSHKKAHFNPKLRRYVTLWRRFGLVGVAFLSPVILSIPVGAFLAVRFGTPKLRLYAHMFVGILFWSIVLGGFATYVGHAVGHPPGHEADH